jgi:effector-binding domain-containing protein
MIIKKTPTMHVFGISEETTLKEIAKFVRVKAVEIYKEAINSGYEITGPVYWIYYGMDGNPDTRFNLEIAVPVQEKRIPRNGFICKTIDPMECSTLVHKGTWDNLSQSYSLLIDELTKSGRVLNGIAREVYINIDFENPENNITEIQLGLNPTS